MSRKRILPLCVAIALAMFVSSFPHGVAQKVSAGTSASPTGAATRYIARYNENDGSVISAVTNAGATVVTNYPEINTIIVDSDNPNFSNDVLASSNFSMAV